MYLFIYQYAKTAKRCIFILVLIIYCLVYITVQSLGQFFVFLKDVLRAILLNIIINLKLKTNICNP